MSYRPVGRSGHHKLVPVTVKPEPSVVKQPTERLTPILIAPPRVELENQSFSGPEGQDYEIPQGRKPRMVCIEYLLVGALYSSPK